MMFSQMINIGSDAELRYTAEETAVLTFSGAYDVDIGNKKITQWIKCRAPGKFGESIAGLILKGETILLHGKNIHTATWMKKDNSIGHSLNATVESVELLSPDGDPVTYSASQFDL